MKWMGWGPRDLAESSLEQYDEAVRAINEEADELKKIHDAN